MIFKKQQDSDNLPDFRTPEGFKSAYLEFAEPMFNIAFNKLRDKEAAKEIVQDIFKSLWERREKIILVCPLRHYLFRAAKLEVLDHIRNRVVRDRHLAGAAAESERTVRDTDEALRYLDMQSEVSRLVDRLPPQCREVYKSSREAGTPNREIALRLSISEKTVESHLTKALRSLREGLKDFQAA